MSIRLLNFIGFGICVALLGYALYSEHVLGLAPCPLCVFQRLGVILTGFVFLAAGLWGPRTAVGRALVCACLGVAAFGTLAIAARHVWLQNLPEDEVPACGAGLDFMLDTLPLKQVLSQVFTGSGECAEVSWRFLGLTMPSWVALSMGLIGFVGLWNNLRRR